MITINNLSLEFGSRSLYKGISCAINATQRIGLVGRNGEGKSTLLELIAQASTKPSSTSAISVAHAKKIVYLPQEVVLASDKTILEETFTAFARVYALLEEANNLELLLEQEPENSVYGQQYSDVQAELAHHNPDKARSEAKEMLMGLGFREEQFNQPVASLSVGWKMRIVLAKLLLQKADFYLLDEPTNHLDIVAKDWFLKFLKKAPFGFLLVCHERYFLDQLCSSILELELGNAKMYTGSFSQYQIQKERDRELLEKAYHEQQREIKAKQETIDRFRAKASKARMAQSMIKALDRIEKITMPPSPRNIHITFPPLQACAKVVLEAHGLAFAFNEKRIFNNVSLTIERGNKIALVAANGVGKTTLFNVLTGKYKPQQGTITFGNNVKPALFEQEQTAALELDKTILENLETSCPNISLQTMRSFLGAFLFSAEDSKKKVRVLSGGEKNKVGMIKVLLQNANFLLLDEPTNHLDIPSKEILLKALKEYKGTIFFVSHDHSFINELATHIIELSRDGARKYEGNYDSYLYHKQLMHSQTEETMDKPSKNLQKKSLSTKEQFERMKKIRALEKKIEELEAAIDSQGCIFVELVFGTPEYQEAEISLKKLKLTLAALMLEWEELNDR